jgi:predicted acetyltransferase
MRKRTKTRASFLTGMLFRVVSTKKQRRKGGNRGGFALPAALFSPGRFRARFPPAARDIFCPGVSFASFSGCFAVRADIKSAPPIMDKQQLREQLTLRRLGPEHLAQFTELFRYVFQVTNEELRQSGYEEGELIRSMRPLLERADVVGWFKDEHLVSQVCVYPCTANVHGRLFAMGGMTGVGTYPEYSGMGLINDLIRKALEHMRGKGQWISYLFPYSIPFYRYKGWEILSDQIEFTVRDDQLPKRVELPGFVERYPVGHPDVLATYDRFARSGKAHGAMLRGKEDWEEYWRWENEEERVAALYHDAGHVPMGLLIYWIQDDIFHIKEMIYLNQEARRGLWNFIGAHRSMIDEVKGFNFRNEPLAFYLDDSSIKEVIEPYFMARIVDARAFLERFPFRPFQGALVFEVSDPVAAWNNGAFAVRCPDEGRCRVTTRRLPGPDTHVVKLDIGVMTSLLMNYRRASFFAELERIHADRDCVALLESAIPNQQPYFSDYF